MFRKNNDRALSKRDAMRDGPGSVLFKEIVSKEEMYDKARLFSEITLKQNCGIGYHTHEDEEEIFVITSGKGIYNDNGNEVEVNKGDVMLCCSGQGHSITNPYEEDLVFNALIVLK